jgi:hypothetical protein
MSCRLSAKPISGASVRVNFESPMIFSWRRE